MSKFNLMTNLRCEMFVLTKKNMDSYNAFIGSKNIVDIQPLVIPPWSYPETATKENKLLTMPSQQMQKTIIVPPQVVVFVYYQENK